MYLSNDNNLLLPSDTSRLLYGQRTGSLPIFEDLSFISPRALGQSIPFDNITQMLLSGAEEKILPSTSLQDVHHQSEDEQRQFYKFVDCLEKSPGNSLYLKTQLFLQRFFGINLPISNENAQAIWDTSALVLRDKKYTLQSILNELKVTHLLSPHKISDDLKPFHANSLYSNVSCKLLPVFSTCEIVHINQPGFIDEIALLSSAANVSINSMETLLAAVESRMDYFHALGARSALCSFETFPTYQLRLDKAEKALKAALSGERVKARQMACYQSALLYHLGLMYAKRNWVQHLYIGTQPCGNFHQQASFPFNKGIDQPIASGLSSLFEALAADSALPKTAITCTSWYHYNTLISLASSITQQHGNAHIQVRLHNHWGVGQIKQQIDTMAEKQMLTSSIGFSNGGLPLLKLISHDYTRRILCQYLGEWAETGQIGCSVDEINAIINNVAYQNINNLYSV